MGDLPIAVVLAVTILLASMVSVELGLSVALIELFAGFVVGNALGLDVPSWLSFIGSFAGRPRWRRRTSREPPASPAARCPVCPARGSRSGRPRP